MVEELPGNSSTPPAGRPGSRWFVLAIVVMLCFFAGVVLQRDRIRAHWWAMRLIQTEDLAQRGYYVASLTAVGDAAAGAVRRLARNEQGDVRVLAIAAMARLPEDTRTAERARLLEDADREVRDSAALALAFDAGPPALNALIRASAAGGADTAAAAVAALGRVESPAALLAVCNAARQHADALVRAQAVETLAAGLMIDASAIATSTSADDGNCDPAAVIVSALADRGTFSGLLDLEKQIAEATAAAQRGGITTEAHVAARQAAGEPRPPARTVSQIAAKALSSLTGRPIDEFSEPRDPAGQAKLADLCREWISERRSGPATE